MAIPTATRVADVSPRSAAKIAGASYVALFALAVFANFAVLERFVHLDDAAATFDEFAASPTTVRLAALAFVVVFALDVLVAWALHQVFRVVAPTLSLLAAWFRIVYTVFLGVGVVFLLVVLGLVGDAAHLDAFRGGQRESAAMLALDAFTATWLVGLTCFGVHLALIGGVIIRTGVATPWLGIALCVAGAAYVFDTAAYTALADYADNEALFGAIVAIPAVIAELAFTVWLLAAGGRTRIDPDVTDDRVSVGASTA